MLATHQEWSPHGYDRAVELFQRHFYDGSHFFRVVPKFLVQFGISYSDNKELQAFARRPIPDDPKKVDPPIKFEPGTISYAGGGPNSRTSQLFISYGSAASLGTQLWETPIGKVVEGMENVESFYSYGDMPPWGEGPVQQKIHGGPEYIEQNFPLTDKFVRCKVTTSSREASDVAESNRVSRKEDHNTDEEDFHKQQAEVKEHVDELREAQHQHRDLRNPKMLGNRNDGNPLVVGAVVVLVFATLAILTILFRSQRKVTAKTS